MSQAQMMLSARAVGNTIGLSAGVNTPRFHFVGASMAASMRPGDVGCQLMLTLAPHDRFGVVALVVESDLRQGPRPNNKLYPILLRVIQSDGKVSIDLERPFVPFTGRLGQVHFEAPAPQGYQMFMTVNVDGQEFSSAPHRRGARFVSDSNFLCRYLAGFGTREDLEAAAEESRREMSALDALDEIRKLFQDAPVPPQWRDDVVEAVRCDREQVVSLSRMLETSDRHLAQSRRALRVSTNDGLVPAVGGLMLDLGKASNERDALKSRLLVLDRLVAGMQEQGWLRKPNEGSGKPEVTGDDVERTIGEMKAAIDLISDLHRALERPWYKIDWGWRGRLRQSFERFRHICAGRM